MTYLGSVVAARWKTGWHWWQVGVRADLEYEVHADDDVEEEVAVEEPEAGVVRPEAEHHVAVVRHGDGVLAGWQVELPVEEALTVEVEGVLQVYLADVAVRRTADADHVESVTVEVERVAQVGLLDWKKIEKSIIGDIFTCNDQEL